MHFSFFLFVSYFVDFLLLCFFELLGYSCDWAFSNLRKLVIWKNRAVNIFNWISKVLSMFLERINGMSIGLRKNRDCHDTSSIWPDLPYSHHMPYETIIWAICHMSSVTFRVALEICVKLVVHACLLGHMLDW